MLSRITLALTLALAAAQPASAAMIEKTGRFGGLQITYKVLLPPGYDAAKTYPAVLVFTGGGQELRGAQNTIEADWRPEAEKRGYIVISPAAPDAGLYFEGGDRAFPEFLDVMRRDYHVAPGRFHVAGHSNGGLSAFHIAAKYPSYFATVTGYPGLLDDPGQKVASLKPMCLYMHVGDMDDGWRAALRAQADSMTRSGFRIAFTVEKNQVHRLKAAELNLPKRLFDEIESCAATPKAR